MKTTLTRATLITAALLACTCAPALAQASKTTNFTGLGVGVTLASAKNKLDFDPTASGAYEGTDSAADLVTSYGFDMGSQWVGTVGLALGLKSTSFGTLVSGAISNSASGKQHIALSFAPGLRVGNEGLVYGKLAYHQLAVNYTSSSGFDDTKTHTGTGIGIGYAYAVSPQIELRGEFESVSYGAQTVGTTSASPKQTNLSFGVLYKF